jgi:di/tricarboxylate transporter
MVSVGPGEHGTLFELEDDELRVIAAETAKPLGDTTAVPGATVFVTCSSTEELARHEAFTLWAQAAGRAPRPGKTWTALGILTAVVVAASFGLAPVELTAFAGTVLMVLTRVLTPRAAVRALDWNVLFILAGSVGLGAIVVESGLAGVLARSIDQVSLGSMAIVVVVFALTTTVMTNLITNAAAASILTPVALGIATKLGAQSGDAARARRHVHLVHLHNPFSHQSNLMVMGPGAYSTRTFAEFGAPRDLVVGDGEHGHLGVAQQRLGEACRADLPARHQGAR